MKNHNNKESQNRQMKVFGLITVLLLQSFSMQTSAQELGFNNHFSAVQGRQGQSPQFEIGISLPLNKLSKSRREIAEASNLTASYFFSGSTRQWGMSFSRNFGKDPRYQYSSLFRDSEYDVDLSLPLYSAPVFNASSSGSSTGISGAYLIGIGAGILLLAAAGGSGGDDNGYVPSSSTISWTEANRRRYEETLSLPICSPIPPADGNEPPCRNPL